MYGRDQKDNVAQQEEDNKILPRIALSGHELLQCWC